MVLVERRGFGGGGVGVSEGRERGERRESEGGEKSEEGCGWVFGSGWRVKSGGLRSMVRHKGLNLRDEQEGDSCCGDQTNDLHCSYSTSSQLNSEFAEHTQYVYLQYTALK